MALTQLQTDAIVLAKRGDFALLDAMELEHRLKNDHDVVCGYLVGGRLRLFSLGNRENCLCENCDGTCDIECSECKGGTIDCEECADDDDHCVKCTACEGEGCGECVDGKLACPECTGTGVVDCEVCDGVGTQECEDCEGTGLGEFDPHCNEHDVVNLDGRVVWSQGDDAPNPTEGARQVGRSWADSVMTPYHAKQKEQAATPAQPIQTPLIPENYSCA
jgi:hypothetical protein